MTPVPGCMSELTLEQIQSFNCAASAMGVGKNEVRSDGLD